ncbi:MAG: Ig-like domain-containing protein [Paludibacteraceae bacterium]|nr:Ig-like domain-containing protein [Paludibacteraceae bacterium]
MVEKYLKKIAYLMMSAIGIAGIHSCANMGSGPQGGPRDMMPPKYIFSTPERSAVNSKPEKAEIIFDEYVVLKDAQDVIVSPPMEMAPEIKSVGKKVSITFKDTLEKDATYIIDFGDKIVDFRESNPIRNYYFEFATGNQIDSFCISGNVVDAYTLVPQENITIGVYSDWTDSTLATKKLERITRTDKNGRFILRGLKEKQYHLCAVKDDNTNFRYDAPGESLAWIDTIITPRKKLVERCDTTWKSVDRDSLLGLESSNVRTDTLIVDSIICKERPYYLPDSIEMRLFTKDVPFQAFKKAERSEARKVTLYFTNDKKQTQKPSIKPTNFSPTTNDWFIVEPSATTDTIHYWIKDTNIVKLDTLEFAMTYIATDSIGAFVEQTDTVTSIYKKVKVSKREERAAKEKKETLKISITKSVEIDGMPVIGFETPTFEFNAKALAVHERSDSTEKPLPFNIVAADSCGRRYKLEGNWEEGILYKVVVDSGKVRDIYGLENDSTTLLFRRKEKKEYSNIILKMENIPAGDVFVELVDKDKIVKRVYPKDNKVEFINVVPGSYAARLIVDTNKDGDWTTGDYDGLKQPEDVYFFEKPLSVSANWDYEEDWVIGKMPLHSQRPPTSYPPLQKKR